MAEEPRQPDEQQAAVSQPAEVPQSGGSAGASAGAEGDASGAPIPPDAVDPDLLRLSVPPLRRHPGVAIAVLAVCLLLLYRLRTDLQYALQSTDARHLGAAATLSGNGQLPGAVDHFVAIDGVPDHRNALAFDPKGGRPRQHVFRLLGTGSRLYVTTVAAGGPPYVDQWSGRLRRFDDLSFADAVRTTWAATLVLRAVDLPKLKALQPGALPSPLQITDRAGEQMTVAGQQDLLIDVIFPDDVRVLLSKDKVPSEADAEHEVERFALPHGPGVETKDGYGYVLRLPPAGPERQRVLAQIDAQGVWLWHRVETYRAPAGAVQVTPAGLLLPGPDALPQPVRYRAVQPIVAPTAARGQPGVPVAGSPELHLGAQKEPSTLLLWEHVQAVQVSEPMTIAPDALVLMDGETPRSVFWTLPMALLLLLCAGFNVWYLLRSVRRGGDAEASASTSAA